MAEQFHGQFGEDRLLADMFRGSGAKACVDVGANDGVTGSVSLYFERIGWRCVLVEPNPDLCARLRRERDSFIFEGAASKTRGTTTLMLAEGADLSHAVSSVEPGAGPGIRRQGLSIREVTVATAPLNEILEEAGLAPGEIGFVSIDVEGHEAAVLEGFDLARWRPRMLIIEDNSLLLGNGLRKTLAQHGYVRFRRTGVNDWYAAGDDIAIVGTQPERAYRASMLRARALMMRRNASRLLMLTPVLGGVIGKALRAARGHARD